ncbi:RING-H2 finger protein ATL66-like [Dendrobium catenatum]|uniref:RING-type E3 ubiquitin transferase n=1 Tax=Dendrobium catenatum TaxID=906689 RepID=A0A2I0WVG8_9ASPA|nr:RING-H2 finger protein ATL66-like [Dendrobium catenatum]PKU79641.1 RING-H2 finger protein ATL66 [Dendrobium catenatum]
MVVTKRGVEAQPIAEIMSQDARSFRWPNGELDDKNFQLHGHNLVLLLLIISFLLLLLLLCFYFRRRCCYHSASPSTAAAGCSGCQGMEEAAVRKLPVRVRLGEAAVCSICLSLLMEGEKEKVLPGCSHGFHPVCVDEWLRKRSSCPVCRASVTGEEEKVVLALPEVVVALAAEV